MKRFTLTTYDADGNPLIETVRHSRKAITFAALMEALEEEVVAYTIKPESEEEEHYWNVQV